MNAEGRPKAAPDQRPMDGSAATGRRIERDPARGRAYLHRSVDYLRPEAADSFVAHVTARLAAGQRAYGNAALGRTPADLLHELTEEAADLGAWAVLLDQVLDTAALDNRERARVRGALREAADFGADAHAALDRAKDALDRAERRQSARS